MLFMVIEHFKDRNAAAVGERFKLSGRMLPEQVFYHSSWMDAENGRCFQIMEAPNEKALQPWISRWDDLVVFEVIPVQTSSDFWSRMHKCT